LLGKAEIILSRPSDATAFEIECARSYAAYVRDFLIEAARGHRAVGDAAG
jgi:sarcosine oxidase subunit gamma